MPGEKQYLSFTISYCQRPLSKDGVCSSVINVVLFSSIIFSQRFHLIKNSEEWFL
jgi:hypothetical protein